MKGETVLVTGAAGTVGAYVVEELVKAGHRVIATDRPSCRFEFRIPDQTAPNEAKVEIRTGDLTDLAFCLDVVDGADAVIHVAATIDLSLSWEDIKRINVDATRYLYEAARARGCRRFVFVSSGSIYSKTPAGPINEDRPIAPQTDYERSKAEAEAYLWSRPQSGTEIVVMRPTMIYGPRARMLGAKLAMLPAMIALFARHLPRITGGPVCNWIHAEDVARSAAFLLDEPRAAWDAFNVADETAMSLGEVLETIATSYGFSLGGAVAFPTRLMRRVGPWIAHNDTILRGVSSVSERVWRYIVGREGLVDAIQPSIDRETFLYAASEVVFDTSKLRGLGFSVKYKSLRDGYPEVMKWFQAQRWLPTYRADEAHGWHGAVGIHFAETMAGTWRKGGKGTPRPFRFTVDARAEDLRRFARNGQLAIDGWLDAAGLAASRPCDGTLTISVGRRTRLHYALAFTGDDGRAYRFEGEKDVSAARLLTTMTTLPGRVLDARGHEVGDCLLRFDLRHDLLSFLGSFGLTAGLRPAEERRRLAAPSAAAPAIAAL